MRTFTKKHPAIIFGAILSAGLIALVYAQFVYAQPAEMSQPLLPPPPPPVQNGGQPPMQGNASLQVQGNSDGLSTAATEIKSTPEEQQEKITLLQHLIDLLTQLLSLQSGGIHVPPLGVTTSPVQGNARPPEPPSGGRQGQGVSGGGNGPGDAQSFEGGSAVELPGFSFPDSDYYGEYTISDREYSTEVIVTINNGVRTIVSNELPNHETGTFPNSGNPNTISAQNVSYSFPADPEYTGDAEWVRELGVAVNGVKFEPETGELVQCNSGETYKYEAIQDEVNLGLDFNNAHVQPTGAYHYHGVPTSLVDLYDSGEDISHIGFAADGHYIMYDNTGTLKSSYQVADGERSGTDCTYRGNQVDIDSSDKDGTYVSDWEYVAGSGDLDACNGAFVDGMYVYFVSDDYPYAGRCVQGNLN